MKKSIAAAAIALLTACSQSAPPQSPDSQKRNTVDAFPSMGEPCDSGFSEMTAGEEACEFIQLRPDGTLMLGEVTYSPRIVVSHVEGQTGPAEIAAAKLVLFPRSRSRGLRILQACENMAPNGLCWAVRLMDPEKDVLLDVAAGKYGPERWLRWSPLEQHVALISRNEGAEWLHVVDTASGATTTYPGETENANWKIDRDSFTWTSDDAFRVNVKTCETCASLPRSFTLP